MPPNTRSKNRCEPLQESDSSDDELRVVAEEEKRRQAHIRVFRKEVATKRKVYIKKRVEENAQKVAEISNNLLKLSKERRTPETTNGLDLLAKRQKDAIDLMNGIERSSSSQEEDGDSPLPILLGAGIPVKNTVRPIKLPFVKKATSDVKKE